MLTQRVPRTTRQCPADLLPRSHAAGARRGTPMCISYQEPGGSNQGQQEESCRIQTRIDRLFQAINMPSGRGGSPHLPIQTCLPSSDLFEVQQLRLPSFVSAELCSGLIFTTWGRRCLWLQTAIEGGASW